MGDKIEMSLDDIIKTSKVGNFRRAGRGGGQRRSGGGGGFRSNQSGGGRPSGGVLKGRNRGTPPQRSKFSRVRGIR